jgi:hypothetical protein
MLDFLMTLTDKTLPNSAIRIHVRWYKQSNNFSQFSFYISWLDQYTVRKLVRKLLNERLHPLLNQTELERLVDERRKKREMRKTILAMGLHPRLGAGSPLKVLSNDLLQLVIKFT